MFLDLIYVIHNSVLDICMFYGYKNYFEEIEKLEHELVLGNVLEKEELLSIMPISFQVDDKDLTKDPKGMEGKTLSLKAVVSIPNRNAECCASLSATSRETRSLKKSTT